MPVFARKDCINGNCGIEEIYDFTLDNWSGDTLRELELDIGSSGIFIASFINNSRCKEAYDELKQYLELVYQSPIKRNENSGNMTFLCVYLRKD